MSEKLDGIRGYWDGKKLLSKYGNDLKASQDWITGLPEQPLDGELCMGRGTYESLISTINKKEPNWKEIQYWIFDLPSSKEPFESRLNQMKSLKLPPHVQVLSFKPCLGMDQMYQYLHEILQLGGEGIIARQPQSFYVVGRTDTLVKIKVNEVNFSS